MKIIYTPIDGVKQISITCFSDSRGAFYKYFGNPELNEILGKRTIKQVNHSRTDVVGTVRGLHFQRSPYAEMKLITCIRGKVLDIAADLRKNSPTYGQYFSMELIPGKMIVIPEGCAHGFQVLAPESELLYLHTAEYAKDYEGGVSCFDSSFNIKWPINPIGLSSRDQNLPELRELPILFNYLENS